MFFAFYGSQIFCKNIPNRAIIVALGARDEAYLYAKRAEDTHGESVLIASASTNVSSMFCRRTGPGYGKKLFIKTHEYGGVVHGFALRNDSVCREVVIGKAHRDGHHDHLVVGDVGMLAHHR